MFHINAKSSRGKVWQKGKLKMIVLWRKGIYLKKLITYGLQTCDLQIETLTQPVTMRRHQTSRGENHRLSESNIMNSE